MAYDGGTTRTVELTSSLGPGSVAWPPPGDLARLRAYTRYRRLHEGDHKRVYVTEGKYNYDTDREYIAVNVCAEITDLVVDRLFGETVKVRAAVTAGGDGAVVGGAALPRGPVVPMATADDNGNGGPGSNPAPPTANDTAQAWIEHLSEISTCDTMFVEMGRGVSYRGDGGLKIRYDSKRQDVLISPVSSALMFVTTADGDVETITSITIAYTRPNPQKPKETLLFQEIHTRGRIDYTLHRVKASPSGGGYRYRPDTDRVPLDTLPELAALAATLDEDDGQDTGVDELLIVPIAMGGSDESGVWGRSDYADVEDLQGELNNRVTQAGGIQDKHSDPWMYGPPAFLTEEQKLDPRYRYFSVSNNEQVPGYITWDANLEHAETSINRLMTQMLFVAGLSPESFGLGEGSAESGRALKLRQHRTASSVRMRQRIYDRAIRTAVSVASKLANSPAAPDLALRPPEMEPEDVTLEWNDGLPNDAMESVEIAGAALTMGIMSLEHAVRMAQPELSDDEVALEIDAITSEKPAAPNPGRVGLGADFEPVSPTQTASTGVNTTTE